MGASVNPSPRQAAVSSMATTEAAIATAVNARPAGLRLARPHLTSPHRSAPPTPASAHLPRPRLSARAAHVFPARLALGLFASGAAEVRSALFLPVRPPSFGEAGGGGEAGKGWEVGERARRPSVVVSWLRAAVAA